MKRAILVIGLFLGICLSVTKVHADHLLKNDGGQLIWGNIWDHSNRVDIGTGTIEGLMYDVTPPSSNATSPCSCQGSNQPMPHGTKILVSTKDGTKTWEWIASEGNDMPIDFYNWWQNSGPGKDFAEYSLSNFGLGDVISVKFVGNSSYRPSDMVRIGLELSSSNMDQLKTLYLHFASTNPVYSMCNDAYLTVEGCSRDEVPLINEVFPLSFLNLSCQGGVPCLFEFPASALGNGEYTLKAGVGGLGGAEVWSQPLVFRISAGNDCSDPNYASAHPELCGHTGKLTFRIFWDDVNDIDLHVITPEGVEIYFDEDNDPQSGGYLDVDTNAGCEAVSPRNNVENIFFDNPPAGQYKVKVHAFAQCTGGPNISNVKVQILRDGVVVDEKQVSINVRENQMLDVTTYTY